MVKEKFNKNAVLSGLFIKPVILNRGALFIFDNKIFENYTNSYPITHDSEPHYYNSGISQKLRAR